MTLILRCGFAIIFFVGLAAMPMAEAAAKAPQNKQENLEFEQMIKERHKAKQEYAERKMETIQKEGGYRANIRSRLGALKSPTPNRKPTAFVISKPDPVPQREERGISSMLILLMLAMTIGGGAYLVIQKSKRLGQKF